MPRYLLLKLKSLERFDEGEMTVEAGLTGPIVQYENTGVRNIAGYFVIILKVFLKPIATIKVISTLGKYKRIVNNDILQFFLFFHLHS